MSSKRAHTVSHLMLQQPGKASILVLSRKCQVLFFNTVDLHEMKRRVHLRLTFTNRVFVRLTLLQSPCNRTWILVTLGPW